MSQKRANRSDADEQYDNYYLPGVSISSTRPGPVERLLTRLFRRRGRF